MRKIRHDIKDKYTTIYGLVKDKKYSEAEAVETLQRFSSLMKTYKGTFVSAEASEIAVGFTTGTVGAAVDGVWNRSADEDALGGNYGAAVLPTVTVDGVKKQMVPMRKRENAG